MTRELDVSEFELISRLIHYTDLVQGSKKSVKKLIQNKEIALETRWALFEQFGKDLFKIHHERIKLPQLEKTKVFCNMDWTGELYIDKYEIVEFVDLIERVLDSQASYYSAFIDVDIDELKEEILSTGYSGFTSD